MGNIGEPLKEIELVPLADPREAPVKEPSPQIPSTPEPVKEPVKVPA